MGKIIGIDLGTTNSVVCIMEGNEPIVIPNEEGGRTTPSVIAFEANGNVLVGQQARRQSITNAENTIFSAKRFIGRRFEEVQDELARVPYKVISASNGEVTFDVRGKKYPPPEVSARVLMKLKKAAEDYLGEPVTAAVITVPAYFNDAQRQATKDAGRIAGLEVKRIVNEPTAAALAYGRSKGTADEKVVAVYDLGGGTFDISILEVAESVVEVISTNGDTHLGGDDFDDRVMDWMIAEFRKDSGIDVSEDKLVRQRLKDAAEKAKIDLSNAPETEIHLPFLTADSAGPKHLQLKLSRARFESMVEDLVARSIEPVKKALEDAGRTVEQIDEILLVGGSTRIPMVQKRVEEFFGKPANKGVNPDEVVGLGAAVQAGVLSGDVTDIVLVDVTPLSLGIETLGGVMTVLIPRNTTIPTSKSETFTTAADNQLNVEVHVLQGERKMAADNRTLDKFMMHGILPAQRGIPQIEVTFDIDANGIVNVSAKDKATSKEHKVKITGNSGLSERDIQRMVDEAKAHEEDDTKRRTHVENCNKLDATILQVEKILAEHGNNVPGATRTEVEEALMEARKAFMEARGAWSSNDVAKVIAADKRLTSAAQKIGESMYGQPPPAAPGAEEPPKAQPEEEVIIDAEYVEKT